MRRSQLIALMFALVTSLTGCVADNASVFIQGNIIPEQGDIGCSLTTDGTLLTTGIYNVDVQSPYSVFPLYSNQLLSRATDVRADPNGVLIMGAEVELQNLAGQPLTFAAGLPNPFSIPASTFIPSGDVGQAGLAAGELQVIPEPYRADFSASRRLGMIVVSVKVFGRTNGNIDIQSGAWTWPVELCGDSCLFECLGPDATTEALSCFPGQDFLSIVDCSTPAP